MYVCMHAHLSIYVDIYVCLFLYIYMLYMDD